MKKKARHRKGKTVSKKTKSPFDKHHIFFIRREWNKGKLEVLRMHPYCIIPLHRETIHKYLHIHLACIPTPPPSIVEDVVYHLWLLEKNGAISPKDSLEKRLIVLTALFECVAQPTADALKEQLRIVREFYNKKAPP